MGGDAKICEVGGSGLLLPMFGDSEQRWPRFVRAVIYLSVLFWHFLGVSIIADIFMGGIETITSKKKIKTLSGGKPIVVKVWNDTVANLTLMALGSSAPEILLSVIEILGNDYFSADLGPSTIVGSAAFNLFIIIAICVAVIPTGEGRRIKQLGPYCVTAVASIFAYLWLIFILAVTSPNAVTVWEGVCTFLFFAVTVVLAYLADVGVFSPKDGKHQQAAEELMRLAQAEGKNITFAEAMRLISAGIHQETGASRAKRRADNAISTDKTVDESRLSVSFGSSLYIFYDAEKHSQVEVQKCGTDAIGSRIGLEIYVGDGNDKLPPGSRRSSEGEAHFVDIPADRQSVMMDIPLLAANSVDNGDGAEEMTMLIEIVRAVVLKGCSSGKHENHLRKSAKAVFAAVHVAGQKWSTNSPTIVGAVENGTKPTRSSWESSPHSGDSDRMKLLARGQKPLEEEMSAVGLSKVLPHQALRSTKVIIRRGSPGQGVLGFADRNVHIQAFETDQTVDIVVARKNGAEGEVQCEYYAEADSGREGWDYVLRPGVVSFAPGATTAAIKVLIKGKQTYKGQDTFFIHLNESPDCPGVLDTEEGTCTCCVTVSDGGSPQGMASRFMKLVDEAVNVERIHEGNLEWAEQFTMAIRPVQGDADDAAEADAKDWAIHLVTLPWKLLFAFVPPPSYCGGWLCFCVALMFIGVVTALIGDLAALLGCVAGIPDAITAITIVALGTSLPDMFASKTAAVQDPTADCAVGNVTGSNAVNVFLGLGLPWMIASIYWATVGRTAAWDQHYRDMPDIIHAYPDGAFIVVAGDLVFSVLIFTICAAAALMILLARRKYVGFELGGPAIWKVNTAIFFVLLWFFYIGLASWKVIIGDTQLKYQFGAVLCGMFILGVSFLIVSGLFAFRKKLALRREKEISDMARAAMDDRDMPEFKSLKEAAAHMRQQIEALSRKCEALERQAEDMEKRQKQPLLESDIEAAKRPVAPEAPIAYRKTKTDLEKKKKKKQSGKVVDVIQTKCSQFVPQANGHDGDSCGAILEGMDAAASPRSQRSNTQNGEGRSAQPERMSSTCEPTLLGVGADSTGAE